MKEYLRNTWLAIWTILIGMKVTFKHLFEPAVTIQYPDVRIPLPSRARNRLYVNIDDCIGCDQCARACPVDCIEIETVKALPTDDLGTTSNGKRKALWVTSFTIDIAKCCFCQLCVFPCPTECIKMTDVYEYSEYERENLIYQFSALTPGEAEEKKANYEKFMAEKAAAKEAAAKAKVQAAQKVQAKPAPKENTDEKKDENKDLDQQKNKSTE